jgi:hypothetical protein
VALTSGEALGSRPYRRSGRRVAMRQRRNVLSFAFRVLPSLVAFACVTACAGQSAQSPANGAAPQGGAAEPSTDPAVYGIVDRRGKEGVSVFAAHLVSDFPAFKKFFEDGAADREKAGVKGHVLTRLDDGRVVIHLFAESQEAIKMTLDSPKLQEYLDKKGAPDASLLWLAHDELVKLPATPPTGQTFSLFIKMRMVDLPGLRRGFVERQPLFKAQGVIASGLHKSVDQADLAFLHFVGTDRAKLEALSKRSDFQDWLRAVGTAEAPTVLLGEDVSRSRSYYADFK